MPATPEATDDIAPTARGADIASPARGADAVRRRCAAIFGVTVEALAAEPIERLRRLVSDAEAQTDTYAEMGFLSKAEAEAFDRLGRAEETAAR